MDAHLAYREGFHEELIGGEIVMKTPVVTNHTLIAGNIYCIFGNYLHGKKSTPFGSSTTVYLTETDRFVPDFMVVCDPDKIKWNGVHGAPDLVVEVLSPSTAKNDKSHKKDVYARCGVREYWLVNPADKSVEQYFLQDGDFDLHAVYTLYPNWMLEGMTEKEREQVVTHFQCSLFDDLDIALEDIFDRTF